MKIENWIAISVLTIIVLASGLTLILQPKYFEIHLQDGSVKAKYSDGVFKLYDGRYVVLENEYSIECYDGSYKKVYKSRGDKYNNISYYCDDSNHYISQVIHYSKGDLTRKFIINDYGIKEALSWNPDNTNERCRVRLKYSGLDFFKGGLIYSKAQDIYNYKTDLEFGYSLDWKGDVEKVSYVKRYDNGRLDIMTLPFTGAFDYDPYIVLGIAGSGNILLNSTDGTNTTNVDLHLSFIPITNNTETSIYANISFVPDYNNMSLDNLYAGNELVFGSHLSDAIGYVGGLEGVDSGVVHQEGFLGTGIRVDGGDYVMFGYSVNKPYLNIGPGINLSISIWARKEGATANSNAGILTSGHWTEGSGGYSLLKVGNNIALFLDNQSERIEVQATNLWSSGLTKDEWYNFFVSVNRTGNANIYVNGILNASTDISNFVDYNFTSIDAVHSYFYIGRWAYYSWNGSLDEPMIWSKALSPEEVNKYYNDTKALRFKNNLLTNGTLSQFTLNSGNTTLNETWKSEVYIGNAEYVTNFTSNNLTIIEASVAEDKYPIISYTSPTTTNGTHQTLTSIWANVTYDASGGVPINYTFWIYNSTGLWNLSEQTTSFVNWTILTDDDYLFNASATTSENLINYTTTRQATVDSTIPTITINYPSTNNNSVYLNNSNTLQTNITVTDDNLYFVNFTIYNNSDNTYVYSNYSEDINQTQVNFSDIVDTSGWTNGYYRLFVRAEDDLTDSPKLPNFKAEVKLLNKLFNPNKITYIDDIEFTVEIKNVNNVDFELFNDGKHIKSLYEIDNPGNNKIKFEVNSDEVMEDRSKDFPLITIGHSKYFHLRDEIENGYEWDVKEQGNKYTIEIWKEDYKSQRVIIDPQAGGLNIVESNIVFFLDNEAPQLTLLSPSNNTSISDENYNFTFSFTDVYGGNYSDTTNCTFYYNNTLNKTQFFNVSSLNNIHILGIPLGVFNWRIDCMDAGYHLNQSETRTTTRIEEIQNVTWDVYYNNSWHLSSLFWVYGSCESREDNCTNIIVKNMSSWEYDEVIENETTPIFKFTNSINGNITNITMYINSTCPNYHIRAYDVWNTTGAVNITNSTWTQVNYNQTHIQPNQYLYLWLYFDTYYPTQYCWDWPNYQIQIE